MGLRLEYEPESAVKTQAAKLHSVSAGVRLADKLVFLIRWPAAGPRTTENYALDM